MKNLDRLGLEYERVEIEKLVETAKRRRETEGDANAGPALFYNDKARFLCGGCVKTTCFQHQSAVATCC